MTGLPNGGTGSGAAPAGTAVEAKPQLPLHSETKGTVTEDGGERGLNMVSAVLQADASITANADTSMPVKPQRLLAAMPTEDALKMALSGGIKMSEADAFAIVRRARARIQAANEERKARKDTLASNRTLEDYRKKCERVDREMATMSPTVGDDALTRSLARHARARQTFQALKTAVRAQTLSLIRRLLQAQDKQQRSKAGEDEGRWRPRWHATISLLAQALSDLAIVDSLQRSDCLEASGQSPRPSRSKRHLLPKVDPAWRDTFMAVNERSPTYRLAGVLLRYCGLRPEELGRGVRVRWSEKGIRVVIGGAKVRETAGQPWRALFLNPSDLPHWFVAEVRTQGRIVVSSDPDALRQHLSRLSQTVLNPTGAKRGLDWNLSAYMFRHALVTDLRNAGWSADEIAPVIGEGSAQTTRWYGQPRGTGGGLAPAAIARGSTRVPRKVRPIDLSDLKELVKSRSKSRLRPRR